MRSRNGNGSRNTGPAEASCKPSVFIPMDERSFIRLGRKGGECIDGADLTKVEAKPDKSLEALASWHRRLYQCLKMKTRWMMEQKSFGRSIDVFGQCCEFEMTGLSLRKLFRTTNLGLTAFSPCLISSALCWIRVGYGPRRAV